MLRTTQTNEGMKRTMERNWNERTKLWMGLGEEILHLKSCWIILDSNLASFHVGSEHFIHFRSVVCFSLRLQTMSHGCLNDKPVTPKRVKAIATSMTTTTIFMKTIPMSITAVKMITTSINMFAMAVAMFVITPRQKCFKEECLDILLEPISKTVSTSMPKATSPATTSLSDRVERPSVLL